MEALIWTILGYLAMPLIFIVGFAITALFACAIMDILKVESLPHRS